MSKHFKIESTDQLLALSRVELEQQANILLYGAPNIVEEAFERQIFSALYIPRNLNQPLVYVEPKISSYRDRETKKIVQLTCEECGRPRHYNSGRRCRFCYVLACRLRFYEAQEGAIWVDSQTRGAWENGQQTGVTMPITEWWDDTIIPARPVRIGNLNWHDRMAYGK